MIDLEKLEKQLDEALAKETKESLQEFLDRVKQEENDLSPVEYSCLRIMSDEVEEDDFYYKNIIKPKT